MPEKGKSEKTLKEEESLKIQERAECYIQERKTTEETKKLSKIRGNKKN